MRLNYQKAHPLSTGSISAEFEEANPVVADMLWTKTIDKMQETINTGNIKMNSSSSIDKLIENNGIYIIF